MAKNKFKFGIDFQELILQYTVTDPHGYKVLPLYDDTYFDLIQHSVIALALKRYYKKNKRIPEKPYLRESLRVMYESDKILKHDLQQSDRDLIEQTLNKIFESSVSEPQVVLDKCINFARFVKFKEEMESVDLHDYNTYEAAINRLKSANNIGFELKKNYGTFLVGGMNDRAHKRDIFDAITPTPFRQINKLFNAGGTTKGNMLVIMSEEKRFKTGMLINIARGYLKMRKRVAYVDLENGEAAITTRSEQSVTRQKQEMIMSGEYDNHLLKLMRRYKRLGAEMVIKKFPALSTTWNDVQIWLDELKRDFGFIPEVVVCDYGMLMASISGKKDDFGRISDSFLEGKNFAAENKLEALWTAVHVTREAKKRIATRFNSDDIAKCIDIPRHIDALYGLQENEEEMEAGVMRLELIEQRNGVRTGKALFWVDIPTQNLREFNQHEIKDYWDQIGDAEPDDEDKPKRKRKSDLDE